MSSNGEAPELETEPETESELQAQPIAARPRRHASTLVVATVVILSLVGIVGAVATSSPSRATASARATPAPGHPTASSAALLQAEVAPPPTSTPDAPGTNLDAGLNQSDPFLTVAAGHYILITSGGTVADPINVPMVTSTDFANWSAPFDALPVLPGWARHGFTWAPDLHRFGTHYGLYFTSMIAGLDPPTQCIGSAFSTSPTGPFTAQPAPIICPLDQGGAIDPRVFVDSDGTPWMLWKSDQNIGGSDTPTKMWSQRISSDGTTLLGSPSFLLSPDRRWQGTIQEAPDMVEVDGAYWLVYSANWYNNPDYAIGAARCQGPAGPCADVTPGPLLASNSQGEGPGEASVFHTAAGIWMLYSPRRSLAPKPDIPARKVFITRLGFGPFGPYLAGGPLPGAAGLLATPIWSPSP